MECNKIDEVRVLLVQAEEWRSSLFSTIGRTLQWSIASSLSTSDNDVGEDDGECCVLLFSLRE